VRVAGRQGDFVSRLGKGARVLVFGRLDIGHFQGKDGETRTSFDVWADDVQSVSSRQAGADAEAGMSEAEAMEPALAGVSSLGGGPAGRSGSGANGSARARTAPRSGPESAGGSNSDELEDLPF
jgi:single-stranded DNA-binding protein